MRAIDRLTANIKSRTKEGIGMIKNITAKSKYNPTPISVLFNIPLPPF